MKTALGKAKTAQAELLLVISSLLVERLRDLTSEFLYLFPDRAKREKTDEGFWEKPKAIRKKA